MSKGRTAANPPHVPTLDAQAGPVDAAVEKGTIADTRRSPMIDASSLWRAPSGYHRLPKEDILTLSKVAESERAAFELAVRQIIDKGPTLSTRFGELAPDTTAMSELWKRYQEAAEASRIAEAQVAYFGDIAQVALNDLLQIIGMVDDTVRPASTRNAQLAQEFSAVLLISDQRGNVIRDARGRAKKRVVVIEGEAKGGPKE